jgi:ParB-like chromosome segregation protein Spo0J
MSDGHLKQNKIVPLDKLTAHPRNYRRHPEAQISKLVSSLVRFGQGRSIVCQDGPQGYLIVAGHGIVEAAKKLNYSELRADILPASWNEDQITGYLLADNLHSQDADDEQELLAQLLSEQQEAGYDLASLGTDDEALRQMLASLDEDIRESMKVDQERTYEKEALDGSDRKFGTTPEQYLERYEATDIRQIVLIYDKAEFIRIMRIFDKIRKQENLETNTDVVTILLEQYAEEHRLEEYDA